jgi:predicted transposase YbfD/YdcC
VVAQLRVDAKTNEHKAALEMLGVLPLRGRVVTADAMFTHRDICSAVIEGGGDYILPAKENQPTLLSDIAAAFAGPPAGLSPRQASLREASFDRARSVGKGHGRVEVRSLEVTTWLAGYLGPDWPGCRQVFRLGRERRRGGAAEVEVVYGITSLPRERAGAAELLGLTRAHWGIENGLHNRRDGALREDAGRARRGAGAQVMAIIRNIVIYLRRLSGQASLAAATRHHMCHPEKSVELVSIPRRQ